jgi:DNA-binding CsgD family transcriptional regulator
MTASPVIEPRSPAPALVPSASTRARAGTAQVPLPRPPGAERLASVTSAAAFASPGAPARAAVDRPTLATVASLLASAQTEIHAVIAGGWDAADFARVAHGPATTAAERGIRVRVLLQDAVLAQPAWHVLAGRVAGNGGEVRGTPLVPASLLMVDRSIALFSIGPHRRAGTFVTRDRVALRLLDALFRHEWHIGAPHPPAPERAGSEPDDLELALLDLLASGAKDETAARLLGMSVRSVRRRVAELMSRLGAGSRFEAGVRAAECGWATSRMPSSRSAG